MELAKTFVGKDGNTYRKNPNHDGKYSYAVYQNGKGLFQDLIEYVTTEQAEQNYIEPNYTFQVTIYKSTKLIVTDSNGRMKEDVGRQGCFKVYLAFIRKLYGCENVSYQLIEHERK